MLSTIIKVILIGALLLFLVWAGACVYSNFIAKPDIGQPTMPEAEEVSHAVYIKNTGTLILTNEYEQHGSEVGSRVFILHGFWEQTGQEFVYKNTDLILNEAIFGEINVNVR